MVDFEEALSVRGKRQIIKNAFKYFFNRVIIFHLIRKK